MAVDQRVSTNDITKYESINLSKTQNVYQATNLPIHLPAFESFKPSVYNYNYINQGQLPVYPGM